MEVCVEYYEGAGAVLARSRLHHQLSPNTGWTILYNLHHRTIAFIYIVLKPRIFKYKFKKYFKIQPLFLMENYQTKNRKIFFKKVLFLFLIGKHFYLLLFFIWKSKLKIYFSKCIHFSFVQQRVFEMLKNHVYRKNCNPASLFLWLCTVPLLECSGGSGSVLYGHHRLVQDLARVLPHVSTVRWLPYYRKQATSAAGNTGVGLLKSLWQCQWLSQAGLCQAGTHCAACDGLWTPAVLTQHPARVRQRDSLQLYHSSSESWTSANKRQRKQLIVS